MLFRIYGAMLPNGEFVIEMDGQRVGSIGEAASNAAFSLRTMLEAPVFRTPRTSDTTFQISFDPPADILGGVGQPVRRCFPLEDHKRDDFWHSFARQTKSLSARSTG